MRVRKKRKNTKKTICNGKREYCHRALPQFISPIFSTERVVRMNHYLFSILTKTNIMCVRHKSRNVEATNRLKGRNATRPKRQAKGKNIVMCHNISLSQKKLCFFYRMHGQKNEMSGFGIRDMVPVKPSQNRFNPVVGCMGGSINKIF